MRAFLIALLIMLPACSSAWRLADEQVVNLMLEHFQKKIPLSAELVEQIKQLDASDTQNAFVQKLRSQYGQPAGYKVALTNPKAQQKFNTNAPVSGILLEKMLLPNGSEIALNHAAIGMMEADLLVRIKNTPPQDTRNAEELLPYLESIIPFLELPDLMIPPELINNSQLIKSINTGARAGVMGEEIKIQPGNTDWYQQLHDFEVTLKANGEMLASGKGEYLMGHPLNVLLWLIQELAKEGHQLTKGQLVSLGSITPPLPLNRPADRPTNIQILYKGLGNKATHVDAVISNQQ